MTITFLPVDADTSTLLPKYTAQQFRQGHAATYGGGSGRRLGGRSGFRVDTPSNILTATSTTWTLGPCAGMIDPGFATHQGMYGWATDTNITGTGPTGVVAADATNPRKDIVYIQIDDKNIDGSGALAGDVKYLAGTPATTPAAPSLPARSFLVGTITVPQVGGGSPTVALNTARFVSAGGIQPVADAAERTALSAYEGLIVDQKDVDRLYRHNGTRWAQTSEVELGHSITGTGGTLAASPSWSDLLVVTATSLGGEVTVSYKVTLVNANSGAHRSAAIRVTCDGAEVDAWAFTCPWLTGIQVPTFPALDVSHVPAAGAHTWKIQAQAGVGEASSVQIIKGSIVVTEKP
jgi:hypothetical protein